MNRIREAILIPVKVGRAVLANAARLLLPLAVVTLVLGCASETDEPAPKTTTTEREIDANDDMESMYVDVVRDGTTTLGNLSDVELVGYAKQICADAIADDLTFDELIMHIANVATSEGLSRTESNDFAYAVGAAVPAFCPEVQE